MSGETEEHESGWTVDTLKYYTDQQFRTIHAEIVDLRMMLDERYQTQTKATDAAFAAQQKAMETAFTAADRAVQTALLSAKEAVTKAEMANEKRFEAVNEFRSTLADQTATFATQRDADMAHERFNQRITELTDRVNLREGNHTGSAATSSTFFIIGGLVLTVVIFLVTYLTDVLSV